MKKELWRKAQKNYKPDPLFSDLSEELKDPKSFKKVQKLVLAAGDTGHEHKYMVTYMKCKHCQQKFIERKAIIKKLGFSSYEQYLQWRRVMDIIVNKKEIRIPTK